MDLGKKPPKRKKVRKVSKYDRANIRVINGTYDLLDELFARLIEQVARMYAELPRPTGIDPDNLPPPFKLAENPLQAVQVEAITKELGAMLERAIERGIEQVQEISNQHLRDLVTKHLGKDYDLTPHLQKRATAVAKRKQERFYSERVWKSMEQVKSNIETAIDLAIVEGRSADQLSRDLREFLNQPDKLFRRVRDKRGVLHLSENARAYQPGMGVYRSSYKNAKRLAGTEINKAYRTADHERWKELDMVVGVRISLSNNHTCLDSKGVPRPFYDICDELEGDYPKDFKFTAWHPNCRCIATPILKTPEELRRDRQRIRNGLPPAKGSKNEVKELPDNFKEWQARNAERIARAEERGTTPHFLRDNQHLLGVAGGGGGKPPMRHTTPEEPEREGKARFDKFDTDIWEKTKYYPESDGYVVRHKERIKKGQMNKQEAQKLEKETRMCHTYAKAGYRMELLEEISGISSHDALINDIKADLKSVKSYKRIEMRASEAKDQGAELVLFELKMPKTKYSETELDKIRRKGVKGLYYYMNERKVRKL